MNSVQTVTLNSALSQNGVGFTQCAHPEPRSRAHCAHSAHVVGATARTASLSRACRSRSQRRSRACLACTCRDTPRQPAPKSQPHFDVATPRQPTSCRDILFMSRHQACSAKTGQVATSLPGRNLCMSRPPN